MLNDLHKKIHAALIESFPDWAIWRIFHGHVKFGGRSLTHRTKSIVIHDRVLNDLCPYARVPYKIPEIQPCPHPCIGKFCERLRDKNTIPIVEFKDEERENEEIRLNILKLGNEITDKTPEQILDDLKKFEINNSK